jgi:hypothetical protein
MRSSAPSPNRSASRLARLLASLVAFSIALPLIPQTRAPATTQQSEPSQHDSPYTLHVYADLVQIPTLVLDADLGPLPPIAIDRFNITLDSGPRFRPTQMRLEGDDPIDLAILLDLTGDVNGLRDSLTNAIRDFTSQSLLPHDHISIYAVDCAMRQTEQNIPATDGEKIASALDALLHSPVLHGKAGSDPHCAKSLHLWNVLATVAAQLSSTPGRRVILAITTGRDQNSTIKWEDLRHYAASRSIAIFGMYLMSEPAERPNRIYLSSEDPYISVTQLTGGMILFTSSPGVAPGLTYVIDLVRGRYILEFPRPDKGQPGQHSIVVTIAKTNAFIRPAGISVPLPDPTLLSDPTTVPSPASPASFGKRRPLSPHN